MTTDVKCQQCDKAVGEDHDISPCLNSRDDIYRAEIERVTAERDSAALRCAELTADRLQWQQDAMEWAKQAADRDHLAEENATLAARVKELETRHAQHCIYLRAGMDCVPDAPAAPESEPCCEVCHGTGIAGHDPGCDGTCRYCPQQCDCLRRSALGVTAAPESEAHPEAFCQRCHRPNVWSWHAPSPLWNAVMRDPETGKDAFSVVCPPCFAEMVSAKGIGTEIDGKARVTWCFRPHGVDVAALWTDTDGRTWDAATCLWRAPESEGAAKISAK